MTKKIRKYKSWYLYLHGLVTGAVAMLFLWDWTWSYFIDGKNYVVPVGIALTHTLIDLGKLYTKDDLVTFVVDQFLHVSIIFIAWIYLTEKNEIILPYLKRVYDTKEFLVLSVGFATVIWPINYIITKATEKWKSEVENDLLASTQTGTSTTTTTPLVISQSSATAQGSIAPNNGKESLDRAGMFIGILERVLVLILVLESQYEAIGFLIAAKSILRFSDKSEHKPRKQTEYVLIGTLISFTLTIVIGLLIKLYLGIPPKP